MATAYLSRTPSSAGNRKTWTFSTWLKRSDDTSTAWLMTSGQYSVSQLEQIYIETDDKLNVQGYNSGGSNQYGLETNRLFRDPAAWYHIVIRMDTTQAVAANRLQIYVNGVKETSFATENYPAQDYDTAINNNTEQSIGRRAGTATTLNGLLAHTHMADGQSYAPTVFGETDSTSGIWIAKTAPSVTYGTNGYFLKYASGATGTDSSGKGNNFTVSGNLTNLKDSPDDNFITLNPLDNKYSAWSFSNCNNTITMSNSNETYTTSTVGLSKGLWYWEVKITDKGANQNFEIGIASEPSRASGSQVWLGYHPNNYGLYGANGNIYNGNGSSSASYGVSVDEGDILGIYLDLDASKIYYAKNGAIMNSGTGLAITAVGSTVNGFYFPAIGKQSGASETKIFDFNFGNGYFGITAISNPEDDAGGEGAFKYNPSTGTFDGSSKNFRAICTNNIATYG